MNTPASTDPRDLEPLRDGSSLMAYLHILSKAHAALVGHDAARRRFRQLRTRGHARQYIDELMPALLRERERHRQLRLKGPPAPR